MLQAPVKPRLASEDFYLMCDVNCVKPFHNQKGNLGLF